MTTKKTRKVQAIRYLKTVEETSRGRIKMMRKEKDQATRTAKVTRTGWR